MIQGKGKKGKNKRKKKKKGKKKRQTKKEKGKQNPTFVCVFTPTPYQYHKLFTRSKQNISIFVSTIDISMLDIFLSFLKI